MSSNIATRRTTRVTRTTTAKDIENANARPSRIATRTKPPSSVTAAKPSVSRATATTAASRAKANAADAKITRSAGKRKREALGEVTGLVTNKSKPKPATGTTDAKTLKGKTKDAAKPKFDGIVLKEKGSTQKKTSAGPTTRRVTRRTANVEVIQEVVEVAEAVDENAMLIDPPVVALPRPLSLIPEVPHLEARALLDQVVQPAATRKSETFPLETVPRVFIPPEEEADDDANRVFKKRRTSSEPPPDVVTEEQANEDTETDVEVMGRRFEHVIREPEADPDGDEWEDLDREDGDDPLMVSEYVTDIFKYLKELEQTTMPNPHYMESQHDLAWKMRGILTDWLIQVHLRFHLLPETLFLSVNIIDRFLSLRVVSLAKLQLVGITCMFIAAKFEEIVSPSVSHFLHCADASYTEAEILQAERYVLKTLDYNLSYPNPVHYLRRVSKADDYDVRVRTIAKYLLEIGCLEWRLIAAPPSLMAAASIWLARLVLCREVWTPNLAHYSTYAESSLVPTANLMLNFILKPVRHESFFQKYASKRYLKASVYLREWALEHWPENTQVCLAEELPLLKAEIRLMRERTEAGVADYDEDEL